MTTWYDEVFEDCARLGYRVEEHLYDGKSRFQRVEVFDTRQWGRILALDGVFHTSEKDEFYYHEMLVHPAMVTAKQIERALIIGGGDGGVLREIARYDDVDKIDMVEIDETVVEVCKEYLGRIGTAWDDPRLDLRFDDGARFIEDAAPGTYDIIIVDGPDPVGPGLTLFEQGFYDHCLRALRAGGVFAMQTESPILTGDLFSRIQADLRDVFSETHPYFGPVPIYGAGTWSWTHASASVDPHAVMEDRMGRIETDTRYYNRDIHHAAFALPNMLRR